MALTDNQKKFIDLYFTGDNMTNIAKRIGVSRQSCYKYLDNDEVKAEMDRRLTEIKSQADKKLKGKLDVYISKLEEIAFNGKSEKTRADTLQYLVDRVLGKTTTKVEDVSKDNNGTKVDLDNQLKELDNIVQIEGKRNIN